MDVLAWRVEAVRVERESPSRTRRRINVHVLDSDSIPIDTRHPSRRFPDLQVCNGRVMQFPLDQLRAVVNPSAVDGIRIPVLLAISLDPAARNVRGADVRYVRAAEGEPAHAGEHEACVLCYFGADDFHVAREVEVAVNVDFDIGEVFKLDRGEDVAGVSWDVRGRTSRHLGRTR